jgi:hypothetical protein
MESVMAYFRYYPSILLAVSRTIAKALSQVSCSPYQESNTGTFEYERGTNYYIATFGLVVIIIRNFT